MAVSISIASHVHECEADFSFHASFPNSAVMGTWLEWKIVP